VGNSNIVTTTTQRTTVFVDLVKTAKVVSSKLKQTCLKALFSA